MASSQFQHPDMQVPIFTLECISASGVSPARLARLQHQLAKWFTPERGQDILWVGQAWQPAECWFSIAPDDDVLNSIADSHFSISARLVDGSWVMNFWSSDYKDFTLLNGSCPECSKSYKLADGDEIGIGYLPCIDDQALVSPKVERIAVTLEIRRQCPQKYHFLIGNLCADEDFELVEEILNYRCTPRVWKARADSHIAKIDIKGPILPTDAPDAIASYHVRVYRQDKVRTSKKIGAQWVRPCQRDNEFDDKGEDEHCQGDNEFDGKDEDEQQYKDDEQGANSCDREAFWDMADHDVLRVNSGAVASVIKAAYRKSCLLFHPDKHTDPEAKRENEKKMKRINIAYENLIKAGSPEVQVPIVPTDFQFSVPARYRITPVFVFRFVVREPSVQEEQSVNSKSQYASEPSSSSFPYIFDQQVQGQVDASAPDEFAGVDMQGVLKVSLDEAQEQASLANADIQEAIIKSKVADQDAQYVVLLEYRRCPQSFREGLMTNPKLAGIQQSLAASGFPIELSSRAKVFVHDYQYEAVVQAARNFDLNSRHVFVSTDLESHVLSVIEELPKADRVKLKSHVAVQIEGGASSSQCQEENQCMLLAVENLNDFVEQTFIHISPKPFIQRHVASTTDANSRKGQNPRSNACACFPFFFR